MFFSLGLVRQNAPLALHYLRKECAVAHIFNLGLALILYLYRAQGARAVIGDYPPDALRIRPGFGLAVNSPPAGGARRVGGFCICLFQPAAGAKFFFGLCWAGVG